MESKNTIIYSFPEKFQHLDESLKKTRAILKEYMEALEQRKNTVLQECELEEELFFQYHLFPLWEVWKNLLQTDEILGRMTDLPFEKKLQQVLFYQDVTKEFCHERNLSV